MPAPKTIVGGNDNLGYSFDEQVEEEAPKINPGYISLKQSRQLGLKPKDNGAPKRHVANAIQRQLNAEVMFRGKPSKLRDVYALLTTEAVLNGEVELMNGKKIVLSNKLWTEFAIKLMEHLDGKAGNVPLIDNRSITVEATTDDIEALKRIYG